MRDFQFHSFEMETYGFIGPEAKKAVTPFSKIGATRLVADSTNPLGLADAGYSKPSALYSSAITPRC